MPIIDLGRVRIVDEGIYDPDRVIDTDNNIGYEILSLVSFDVDWYLSIQPVPVGITPTNTAYWVKLSKPQESIGGYTEIVALWVSTRDYSIHSVVLDSDGNLYSALLASGPSSNDGPKQPINSPTYWRMIGKIPIPVVQISNTSITANTDFAVPQYTVGLNSLEVFIEGLLCVSGIDSNTSQYIEIGTNNTISTNIRFYDAYPSNTNVAVISRG
jgi:hypothetical protein